MRAGSSTGIYSFGGPHPGKGMVMGTVDLTNPQSTDMNQQRVNFGGSKIGDIPKSPSIWQQRWCGLPRLFHWQSLIYNLVGLDSTRPLEGLEHWQTPTIFGNRNKAQLQNQGKIHAKNVVLMNVHPESSNSSHLGISLPHIITLWFNAKTDQGSFPISHTLQRHWVSS